MTLDDNAVLLPGTGFVFFNDTVGAKAPAVTPATIAALDLFADTLPQAAGGVGTTTWKNLGHTSLESNIAIGKDGSEGDVKGTYQRPNLRKMPDKNIWSVLVPALQFTNLTLDLYFGEGDQSDPDAYWVIPDAPVAEGALWVCLVDGPTRLPFVVPKVAAGADDAPEFDPENFTELPVKFTALDYASAKGLMGWYKSGLGTPA